jgi:hypothetical protein
LHEKTIAPCSSSKVLCWVNFFKLEDNGIASLAHLLLGGFVAGCFWASAYAADCRLVEAGSSSGYLKKKIIDLIYRKCTRTLFPIVTC